MSWNDHSQYMELINPVWHESHTETPYLWSGALWEPLWVAAPGIPVSCWSGWLYGNQRCHRGGAVEHTLKIIGIIYLKGNTFSNLITIVFCIYVSFLGCIQSIQNPIHAYQAGSNRANERIDNENAMHDQMIEIFFTTIYLHFRDITWGRWILPISRKFRLVKYEHRSTRKLNDF